MPFNRRDFFHTLAIAGAGGFGMHSEWLQAKQLADQMYDLPPFGNVHFLHFTDCHAQLLPTYYREPHANLGIGSHLGKVPHLVGKHFLQANGIAPHSRLAYAFTSLEFAQAAKIYGKLGGFAHLATLIKQLRGSRPKALLLDGGDTWQGSGTSLWTKGQDMVDACLQLGVDVMTAHWEMTLGEDRIMEIVQRDFKGKIDFIAQNIRTADFGDSVFPSYTIKEMNGVKLAVIGQAYPYTPIANPSYFTPNWTFGIQEDNLQKTIDEVRALGAKVVILLSHNGMDLDLKMASRLRGLDAILGGHTHDGVPTPVHIKNAGGTTLVTNAGSHGKFLGVLDFSVRGGQVLDFRYKLLPVFADLIPADVEMTALIQRIRKPYLAKLEEPLASTSEMLYRRGNFNGSFDQLILESLMAQKNTQIAFSPGFRWGTTVLPGQAITMEQLLEQTAITYPQTTVNIMTGQTIKTILEDVADNLFNPDPYYQQGGDMVRVGGMQYKIDPSAAMGHRISDMWINDKRMDAGASYSVAGWGSVRQDARDSGGEPVWEVVARHLKEIQHVPKMALNTPHIKGIEHNPGIAPA